MSAVAPAVPTAPSERVAILDIVRGVALLGIFIMNLPWFGQSGFAGADGSHLWPDPLNRTAEVLRDALFAGKFNSMFSLLFGIGFTIQLQRLQDRQPDRATLIYCRRLLALLAFGLIHACVFWVGDILHVYALLGFMLLALRRVSDRTLVIIIVASLLYPLVIGPLRMIFMTPDLVARLVADAKVLEAADNLAFGSGTFVDTARQSTAVMLYGYTDPLMLTYQPGNVFPFVTTMLLGLLIGRHRWYLDLEQCRATVVRLQRWALGIGLVSAAVLGIGGLYVTPFEPGVLRIVVGLAFGICRLGLMAFYVLTIVRMAMAPSGRAWLEPFAIVGRMPLTNYLFQTALGIALFYGWAFGQWGRIGPAAELLIAPLLFFAVQAPLTILWLRRFEQGPMEHLWRVLTYGRRPATRALARTRPV
jgi:uncharacterized protein